MAMLPWWIHYPNVNNEIINLDWILQISNENTDKIENFIGVNTIKYADPILWDITSQYEANTIVVDPQTGDAYISTKAVPYGVALSNDGYWTRIYNYASEIHTFREQIAADEQLSTTATAPRSVDDLVFLNGLLYRVTSAMIAGDSYVEGSNCVKTTINAELLRLHTSINTEAEARAEAVTAEASARADADTALGQRITDEATARADADTALGQRIDDEAQAREDADTALGQRIDNLDVNHVYNQSTPDSGLTSNIGLKEGVYNITSNTTINAQLVVPKGAIINIDSGVTLTINGSILAGPYKIFEGYGDVVITENSEVYPEWWGAKNDSVTDSTAAFQKAINAISAGVIILQSGKYNIYTSTKPENAYVINDTLTLNKNNIAIRGIHRACILSTATITIDIEGVTDNGALTFVQGHYIENIIFFYDHALNQPTGYNTVIAIKNHGSIRNYIKFCEFYNFYTAYYTDTIVANYFINNTVHVPNYIYCTGVYLNDNIVNSAIYPNASQHIDDSIFLIGDQAVGITAIGDVLSDLFVRNNEFGGGYRGISMSFGSGSGTKTSYDIHITENIFDNIAEMAIECTFADNENSSLLIAKNWFAHRSNSAIVLQHVHNANISDNIINGTLGTSAQGIALVYCKNIIVKGNILESCVIGIDTAICELLTITDNSFIVFANTSTHTYVVGFRLGSQVGNSILGNNIIDADNGALTNGIVVSATVNIINWNIEKNTTDNIATGNIVNGVTI